MAIRATHEIHHRRFGRNLGLALALVGFVALVFALTMVKVMNGGSLRAYNHRVQTELLPPDEKAGYERAASGGAAADATEPKP